MENEKKAPSPAGENTKNHHRGRNHHRRRGYFIEPGKTAEFGMDIVIHK